MVNWNGMFNEGKNFGENWFRGKPSVKGAYVTHLYLFTCPRGTFFWDCILEQPLNRLLWLMA
jgi:hypothetical protein